MQDEDDEANKHAKKMNNPTNLCEDLVSLCSVQHYTDNSMCERTRVREEDSGQERAKKSLEIHWER